MFQTKCFITCLLFLICALNIQAQTRAIDSISRLINKSTSDTQRINLKLSKLKILSSSDLDSAIAFGNTIIEEAKKINYKQGEAKARIRMAGDYCFKGDYAAAKNNLDVSKAVLSHLDDSMVLGDLYNIYGMMYSMQNKFDTSHLFYNKAIAIGQTQKDKSSLSTVFQNNAIAYQQQSNYPQALTNYQSALNITEQLHDEESAAYIFLNIAITYTSLDEHKRAEQSFLKAIDLAKKLDLKNVLAYGYANLASLYDDINNYKQQYEYAMKATVLANQLGDKGLQASSLSRAATALSNQNKFEDAEKLSRQAISIADSSGQPLNIFQAYNDMGTILKMQKNYSQAIPYFEKAFHSLSESDIYDEEVGISYANLSECYERTGNFNKALATYKMSAKISDSIRGKENVKKATELTMNYEFDKKQQIAKAEQQKKMILPKTKQTALISGLTLTIILSNCCV